MASAQCKRAKAIDKWRRASRKELARKRMRVTDHEFESLLSDYGRLSNRLASNGDVIGADWPARVGLLAEVVLDARSRVEMVELEARVRG